MRRFGYFSGCCLRSFFTTLLCALMVMTPAPVYTAAGDLNPIFGNGGNAIIDFGSENVANAVAPTGGIVSGRVWHDANQNYQIDDDEKGIASLPITLTIGYSIHDCINPPLGCHQVLDTTITSSTGYYTLQKFEITCSRCALGLEVEPPPQYPFATLTAGSISLQGDDLNVNLGFFEGYHTWLPMIWK